jgi:hypothetical protein
MHCAQCIQCRKSTDWGDDGTTELNSPVEPHKNTKKLGAARSQAVAGLEQWELEQPQQLCVASLPHPQSNNMRHHVHPDPVLFHVDFGLHVLQRQEDWDKSWSNGPFRCIDSKSHIYHLNLGRSFVGTSFLILASLVVPAINTRVCQFPPRFCETVCVQNFSSPSA